MSNEEKLTFILDYLNLEAKEIADRFGIHKANVSKFKDRNSGMLKKVHLYGFEQCYGIPYTIFEDQSIKSQEQIKAILDRTKHKNNFSPFVSKDQETLQKLVGTWYIYLYSSNSHKGLHEIITTINEDCSVYDQYDNRGKLFISERQSMIIKKSFNSKNLVSITFNNADIGFELFKCSLISRTTHIEKEMLSFGFISKEIRSKKFAQELLGDIAKAQMQIDESFQVRLSNQYYNKE